MMMHGYDSDMTRRTSGWFCGCVLGAASLMAMMTVQNNGEIKTHPQKDSPDQWTIRLEPSL